MKPCCFLGKDRIRTPPCLSCLLSRTVVRMKGVCMKTGMKIGVSLLLLTGLLIIYGSEEMVANWRSLSTGNIIGIICLCTMSLAILAKRFQRVLSSEGIRQTWMSTFTLQLMGLTLNQFIPGLFGGDLLRATYYMPDYEDKKRFLTAAVLFERLNGFLAILCIGLLGSLYVSMVYRKPVWIVMVLATVGGLSILFWVFTWWNPSGKERIWSRGLQITHDIFEILRQLFSNRALFSQTFALSCLSQCISIATYWYLLQVMDIHLPLLTIACVVALSWLVTLVPVSLNGLGIRESGLVLGLVSFGVIDSTALAISLIALLPTLLYSVVGACFLIANLTYIIRLNRLLVK